MWGQRRRGSPRRTRSSRASFRIRVQLLLRCPRVPFQLVIPFSLHRCRRAVQHQLQPERRHCLPVLPQAMKLPLLVALLALVLLA